MENDPVLINFIKRKREYEENEWKIFWIFECLYVEELKEIYGKKMLGLEDKIDDENFQPKKLGDFLMCGFARKNFEESVSGEKSQQVKTAEVIESNFRCQNHSRWIMRGFHWWRNRLDRQRRDRRNQQGEIPAIHRSSEENRRQQGDDPRQVSAAGDSREAPPEENAAQRKPAVFPNEKTRDFVAGESRNFEP
jgi:hypothetical protein